MKRIRITAALSAAALCLFLLAACGQAPQPTLENEGPPALRTVTDASGRAVELPETVGSIVCVNVGALRYTAYMQALDLVVGVEQNELEPRIAKPFSYFNNDRFSALPVMGDNGTTYDEEIVKLAPDVIMAYLDGDAADALQAKTGIPVVTIPHNEGMFDDNALLTLQIMGQVYGREDRAEELTEYLLGLKEDLDSRTRDIPDGDKPTAYVAGVSYKGSHGFEGTEAGYPPLAAVNAVNVADRTGQSGPFDIDLEQILVWDPDVIFLDFNGMGLINENYAVNPDFYNGLSAVKNGRLYSQISFRSNATNADLALADAYYVGSVLFPERFADVDPAEKFDEIFEMLLGVEDAYAQFEAQGYAFRSMTLGA